MKLSSTLVLAAILALAPEAAISHDATLPTGNLKGVDTALKQNFFDWVKEHGKDYPNPKELVERMEIWMENHGTLRFGMYAI